MTIETKAIESLFLKGWTVEQAEGIFSCLASDSDPLNICGLEGSRLNQMLDWCGLYERDPKSLEGQIGYLDYALRNTYSEIGDAIKATKTPEEAAQAFKPLCNSALPEITAPNVQGLGG
jgi:hypothetical protein